MSFLAPVNYPIGSTDGAALIIDRVLQQIKRVANFVGQTILLVARR